MEDDYRFNKKQKRRNGKMKGLTKKLEKLFTAITFAEAGEFDTARELMKEDVEVEKPGVISQKGIQFPATATES